MVTALQKYALQPLGSRGKLIRLQREFIGLHTYATYYTHTLLFNILNLLLPAQE